MSSAEDRSKYGPLAMTVEEHVRMTMRDGVELSCKIYRPDAEGAYPALFAASPYQYETDTIPHSPLFLWREVGPVEWYVSHGYTYVHVDVRGTGNSGGSYCFFGEAEQNDLYDAVEWIAAQDWCDGNVGGIGQSYYAWSQWFLGIVNPPSLRCIAPYDGAIDMYRGCAYHGGIYCDFMSFWYNQLVRPNNLHRPANGSGSGQLLELDLGREFITHQLYDDWWKERSAYERVKQIQVPLLSIGHQGKMGLHERGNILGYEEAECPKKLVLTGAKDVFEAHDLFDKIDFHEEWLKPFYDHYLKGEDNGYPEKTPDVRIYVRGDETWRDEPEWPLPRAEYVPYYLGAGPTGSVTSLNDGSLSTEPPGADGGADGAAEGGSTEFSYPDPQWQFGNAKPTPFGPDPVARNLTFTTDILESDVEVVGPIVFELFASSSTIDTEFFVKVYDQLPQAEEERAAGRQPMAVNVSKGWLRASHREKDEARWKPIRPFYTHANPEPIEPGIVYKYEIEVLPCAYRFRKGHRIRLDLSNADNFFTDSLFTHLYSYYKVGTDTFHHNAEHASRLLLPIVPIEG